MAVRAVPGAVRKGRQPAEVTVTLVTDAEAELAMPEPDWASTMAAYACPFCSSLIFFAAAVLPLKNASQFAVSRSSAAHPRHLRALSLSSALTTAPAGTAALRPAWAAIRPWTTSAKPPAGLAVAPAGSGYRLAVTEFDPLAARYTSQVAQGSHIRSIPAAPRRDRCRPRNEP